MAKKSLVGWMLLRNIRTRKEPFLRFEKPWWVIVNPDKIKLIEIPPICSKPFISKNCKIKDFKKVRITIEEV